MRAGITMEQKNIIWEQSAAFWSNSHFHCVIQRVVTSNTSDYCFSGLKMNQYRISGMPENC